MTYHLIVTVNTKRDLSEEEVRDEVRLQLMNSDMFDSGSVQIADKVVKQ